MATLFRPLFFVRIFGKKPKHPDAHINMRALFDYVPPPPVPFVQCDWPLPARGAKSRPIPKFTVTRPYEPYQPPFVEDNWPLPVKSKLNPKSLLWRPLAPYQPPFFEEEWRNPARRKPKAGGETVDAYALRNTKPFKQEEWRNPVKGKRKATGETDESFALLNDAVVVTSPFYVSDWPNAKSRLVVQDSDLSMDMVWLLAPVAPPFLGNNNWDDPVKGKPKAISESADAYALRNQQPFNQEDWLNATRRNQPATGTFEFFFDRSAVVVTNPFYQNDWNNASTRRIVQDSDLSLDLMALLAPEPKPFSWNEWNNPVKSKPPVEWQDNIAFANLNFVPPVGDPFFESEWNNPTRAKSPIDWQDYNAFAALNFVAGPFVNTDWPTITVKKRGTNNEIVAAYALRNTKPFNQVDWLRSANKKRSSLGIIDVVNRLVLPITPLGLPFNTTLSPLAYRHALATLGQSLESNNLPLFAPAVGDNPKQPTPLAGSNIGFMLTRF